MRVDGCEHLGRKGGGVSVLLVMQLFLLCLYKSNIGAGGLVGMNVEEDWLI